MFPTINTIQEFPCNKSGWCLVREYPSSNKLAQMMSIPENKELFFWSVKVEFLALSNNFSYCRFTP